MCVYSRRSCLKAGSHQSGRTRSSSSSSMHLRLAFLAPVFNQRFPLASTRSIMSSSPQTPIAGQRRSSFLRRLNFRSPSRSQAPRAAPPPIQHDAPSLPQTNIEKSLHTLQQYLNHVSSPPVNEEQQAIFNLVKERHTKTTESILARITELRNIFDRVVNTCTGSRNEKGAVRHVQLRFMLRTEVHRDPVLYYLDEGSWATIKNFARGMLEYAQGSERWRDQPMTALEIATKFSDSYLTATLDHLPVRSFVILHIWVLS